MANGKAVMLALAFSSLVTDGPFEVFCVLKEQHVFLLEFHVVMTKSVIFYTSFSVHFYFFIFRANKTLMVFIHLYI